MFVRLSYHNIDELFILLDAGVIDLNTKCQVSNQTRLGGFFRFCRPENRASIKLREPI